MANESPAKSSLWSLLAELVRAHWRWFAASVAARKALRACRAKGGR